MAPARSAPKAVKTADDSRTRIINAARAAFASAGFEGASTRRIAAEAGVAQSLLLYHFGSKDALWRAVMDDIFATLEARVREAMTGARGGSITELLMGIVTGYVGLCAENADIHRIMTLEGRQETDRLRWLADRHLRVNYTLICALIRRGQEARVIRAGDPTLLYYTVIAIAGTTFSLAPEIRLVSRDDRIVEPVAVAALIRSLLVIAED